MTQEIQRLASAKLRILALLQSAGDAGLTTWEMINATHHSAAARRVWELRRDGHDITRVYEGRGRFRWIYQGPAQGWLWGTA